ncbi:MAG: hypothetical protein OXG44_12635 [Gammaproteobacteria bacterium]|nr:hypothetical protein [Gammaproteobacteria bacterium]
MPEPSFDDVLAVVHPKGWKAHESFRYGDGIPTTYVITLRFKPYDYDNRSGYLWEAEARHQATLRQEVIRQITEGEIAP